MSDFDGLWRRIDGPTLAPTWTAGAALDAPGLAGAADVSELPLIDLAGDFDLEGPLGAGGLGLVFAARQRSLARPVAIKCLSEGGGREQAARLLAEARAAGRLEHPNIVPVHAVGRAADGQLFIVMKRVEGATWDALNRDPDHTTWGRFPRDPIARQLAIALQVIRAVEHAHAAGVVHRDIKPANVVVGPGGEVCLIDWGLAHPVGQPAQGPAGTPGYMAPEMFEPAGVVDARADVFLLGASLFAALTGAAPFPSDRLDAVVRATLAGPAPLPPATPPALAAILERAMAADPAARQPDVAALRAELEGFLERREAERLTDEALASLTALEAAGARAAASAYADRTALDEHFGGARFAFRAALERWPDSPRARDGLDQCLAAMARHELAAGHLEPARRLLSGRAAPAPALEAALAVEQRAAERRAAELAALRAEKDPNEGFRGRLIMIPLIVLLAVVAPTVIGALRLQGRIPHTGVPLARAIGPLVVGAALFAALRWRRTPAFRQPFNRRAFALAGVTCLGIALSFVSGSALGLTVPELVARNLVLVAMAAGASALLLSPAFTVFAVASAIASVGAALTPTGAELWTAGAHLVGVVTINQVWHRQASGRVSGPGASAPAPSFAASAPPSRPAAPAPPPPAGPDASRAPR